MVATSGPCVWSVVPPGYSITNDSLGLRQLGASGLSRATANAWKRLVCSGLVIERALAGWRWL